MKKSHVARPHVGSNKLPKVVTALRERLENVGVAFRFGARVVAGDVYREGITEITLDDIASARDLGYVVKLLAVAEELDGQVAVRVHPAMVPVRHPLAAVRDSFNAVFIEGDAVGELMLYGRGAGGGPTASSDP